MRCVQTFWTAGQSLLDNGFGWPSPQLHLMSWALSCLSLRRNYKDVALYTDSEGYRVFIELLKLPYTEVTVCYDGLSCPQPHWAYPKMLTYSFQKEPFIHVDGDLHLPYRLESRIEQSALIAQNQENTDGTDHLVVITGRNHDSAGRLYFIFMEVGTSSVSKGCSPQNRLTYYPDEPSFEGRFFEL